MPHWKTLFAYKHLGCQDLPLDDNGKYVDMIVTIKNIEKREVIGDGGKTDVLPVADLIGSDKPMILNKTNLDKLATLFGTTDYLEFIGKTVQIGHSKVKGKKGGIVDGLRIRDNKIEPTLVELNPEHPKWNGAKKSLAAGDTTLEAIKTRYSLSLANEKLLTAK